jgi:hypothetical protein
MMRMLNTYNNSNLISLGAMPKRISQASETVAAKSTYRPTDTSVFFGVSPLLQKASLALGYFSIDDSLLTDLKQQVKVDPWAVNWADQFSHFFLQASAINATFDLRTLKGEDSRLHFYWDGQDWFYLYAWKGQTQQFIEVITTADNIHYFRQGKGTHTQRQNLVRLNTTESRGRANR